MSILYHTTPEFAAMANKRIRRNMNADYFVFTYTFADDPDVVYLGLKTATTIPEIKAELEKDTGLEVGRIRISRVLNRLHKYPGRNYKGYDDPVWRR